ncbi:MAG: hypothetical protein KatS3mg110_2098 [Pirellulaceae bacterium]|nr:MAG: hypothetical protein KatS3mg110_2098 [Pirellulaceae bacterium]
MSCRNWLCGLSLLLWITGAWAAEPLALHPENPHYFAFRGEAKVLIGSGEHYGAVLNADFDFIKYLDELAACRLQHTRLFSGSYVEPQGAFNITRNTLAPAPGRYLAPWARSNEPGYANGGNKFDLNRWSDEYFQRLHAFIQAASQREVIVEVNLFCPFYDESQWNLSPQNARNNINGVGTVARTDVYTLDKHGGLLAVHEALTRKIVTELNRYDNIYYEICNEPYFGGVTQAWQDHIADVIVHTEANLPNKHLISMNIANGAKKVEQLHSAVSILNFHYAFPPDAVAMNYHWNRVIGENETGFKGTGDDYYRREAWEFLLAGGALFSHLDYSFAVGYEDGTFDYPSSQPGGGSRRLRHQLGYLRRFMEQLDLVRLRPSPQTVRMVEPTSLSARVLAEPGRQYAAYFWGGPGAAVLEIGPGRYQMCWCDPREMTDSPVMTVEHAGGPWRLSVTKAEAALRLRATEP